LLQQPFFLRQAVSLRALPLGPVKRFRLGDANTEQKRDKRKKYSATAHSMYPDAKRMTMGTSCPRIRQYRGRTAA
jgi:hypothetical protein